MRTSWTLLRCGCWSGEYRQRDSAPAAFVLARRKPLFRRERSLVHGGAEWQSSLYPFDILLCCISSKVFTGCTLPVYAWHTKTTWVLLEAPGTAASFATVCWQLLHMSISSLPADCTPFLPTWYAIATRHCTVRKRQIKTLDAVPQCILAKLYYSLSPHSPVMARSKAGIHEVLLLLQRVRWEAARCAASWAVCPPQ